MIMGVSGCCDWLMMVIVMPGGGEKWRGTDAGR